MIQGKPGGAALSCSVSIASEWSFRRQSRVGAAPSLLFIQNILNESSFVVVILLTLWNKTNSYVTCIPQIPHIVCLIFQSNLSGHKNIIGYVDHALTHTGNGVYEVLLLMPYCRTHVLQMMNSRWVIVMLQIFCVVVTCCFLIYRLQWGGGVTDIVCRSYILFSYSQTTVLLQCGGGVTDILCRSYMLFPYLQASVRRRCYRYSVS